MLRKWCLVVFSVRKDSVWLLDQLRAQRVRPCLAPNEKELTMVVLSL